MGPPCLSKGTSTEGMCCWRNVVKAAAKSGLFDMSARRVLGSFWSGVVVVNPRGGLPAWVFRVVGWVLMIAMVSVGGGLKVVRVLLVLGGGGALLVSVGGVGWFMVVVVVSEEWKR